MFDDAIFDSAIFDTGDAVLVGPRVVFGIGYDDRTTQRGKSDYGKPGSLSGRYK